MAANTVEIIVRATADQARQVLGGLQVQVQQVNNAVAQQTQTVKTADAAAQGYRQNLRQLGSAIAGVAAVASVMARNNEEAQRKFEVLSLALSGVAVMLSAVSSAMKFLISVIGIKIAIVLAVIAAVTLLVRNWDKALEMGRRLWSSFVQWLMRLLDGLAVTLGGLGEIIAGAFTMNIDRIKSGWETMKRGSAQAWSAVKDAAAGAFQLVGQGWDKLMSLLGGKKDKGLSAFQQLAAEAQLARDKMIAHASAIESTVPRQLALIDAQETYVKALRDGLKVAKDASERGMILNAIAREEFELLKLRTGLQKLLNAERDASRRAFEEQRRGERNLPQTEIDMAISGYKQERDAVSRLADEEARRNLVLAEMADEEAALAANRETFGREQEKGIVRQERAIAAAQEEMRHRVQLATVEDQLAGTSDKARQAQIDGLNQVRAAIQAAIVDTEAWIESNVAMGTIAPEAIEKARQRLEELRATLQGVKNQSKEVGSSLTDAMKLALERATRLKDAISSAFSDLFVNLISGAKSFGESFADFFKSIGNTILREISNIVAKSIVRLSGLEDALSNLGKGKGLGSLGGGGILGMILGAIGLFFGHGGIAPGHLTPIAFAAQGMRTSKPTLAMLSEFGHEEAVVPLKDGKIPIEGGTGGRLSVNIYAWDTATGMDKLYQQRDFIMDLIGGGRRSNHPAFRGA